MSKVLTDTSHYAAIAAAIRAKNGDTTALYTPAQMPPAIAALSGGPDLSADTVTPETLLYGVTAHNAAGERITGTLLHHWTSASGNPVLFSGGIPGVPLRSCILSLSAVQSGDGAPSAANVRPFAGLDSVALRTGSLSQEGNLFANSDFSSGLTGWNNAQSRYPVSASVLYDADMGTNCLKIYRGGLSTAAWNGRMQSVSITPGKTYAFLVWLRTLPDVTLDDQCVIQLDFYNANNTGINIETQGQSAFFHTIQPADAPGEWTLFACYATAPAGASSVRAQISLRKNGSLCAAKPRLQALTSTLVSFDRTVYGGTLDVLNGALRVTHGYLASYAGETLPGAWRSSMDGYAAGASPSAGAQVVYELAEPQVYRVTPTAINAEEGTNMIAADRSTDETLDPAACTAEVTYWISA